MLRNIAKAIISSGINKLSSKTRPYSTFPHAPISHGRHRECLKPLRAMFPSAMKETVIKKKQVGHGKHIENRSHIHRKQAEQPICQALNFLEQTSRRKLSNKPELATQKA